MSIFDDSYGVLTLNAMKDLVNEYENPTDENPFMEWGLAEILSTIDELLGTRTVIEISKNPLEKKALYIDKPFL